MSKKVIITIIIILVLVVAIAGGVTAYFFLNQVKEKPEDIWQQYISLITEQKYDEMYNMITNSSKQQISQEEFVTRNKNIYEGIDMANLNVQISNIVEQEDKKTVKIYYTETMETSAGNIDFDNSVCLVLNDEKHYEIEWSHSLIFPQLSSTDKVRVKTIEAERGEIYDKNGVLLAGKGEISSVGIVPGKLGENRDASIEQIANLLGISVDSINKSLSASWVKDDTFVQIKSVEKNQTDIKNQLLQIPGIKITTQSSRVYPLGEAAAHLVGYVQTVTAEDLENNKGKGYTSTSVIGRAGLEKQYEDRLKGTNGLEIYIEDEEGNRKAEIAKIEVKNGERINLTIDSTIQSKLYEELKNDAGFFVVMEPNTGALLALVSTPSYNPNKFVLGMTTDEWNEINNNEMKPMYVRYQQRYIPGSTFKPITGAIGLSTNSLSADDTFSYSGLSWKKDGWGEFDITTLTAYSGPKNLRNALIHSDNIYFAQAALQIGKTNFTSGLDKILFNQDLNLEISTAKSQYSNSEDIENEKVLADSGYGQGELLVNPIHMASIYSAFANDGNMVKPYLEIKENQETEYLVENAFTAEAANTIKEDLIQVVEDPEGTAHDMKVSGRTIAGKTGTAELKGSKDAEADVLSWFSCFSTDSNDNQLLVISMVENGRDLGGSHYLIPKIKTLFQ